MSLFNSKFVLSNKRYGWIDYDRGISIILVTYRHCFQGMVKAGLDLKTYPWLEYINVFFFGFRMPLFFIASGMFFSGSIMKRGINDYLKNRSYSILYPMLVWGIIQIALQLIFSDYTNSKSEINFWSFINLIINPRATGQFWYLNALFFVGVIYALLRVKLNFSKQQQLILGIILYLICASIFYFNIYAGFVTDICKYYLFFAIGDNISSFMLDEKKSKIFTSWKFILTICFAFLTTQYFSRKMNLNAGDNYYIENQVPQFFLIVALVGCTFSICVSFLLKKYDAFKFLRVIGYNSVHIYCLQIIVMSISRQVFSHLFHINNIPLLVLLTLMAGIFLPMVIYNLCLRVNLWWMFSLKKPIDELNFIKSKQ